MSSSQSTWQEMDKAQLEVVCGWCGRHLGYKHSTTNHQEQSHGICQECYDQWMAELQEDSE